MFRSNVLPPSSESNISRAKNENAGGSLDTATTLQIPACLLFHSALYNFSSCYSVVKRWLNLMLSKDAELVLKIIQNSVRIQYAAH
jgi:hypothetical protein